MLKRIYQILDFFLPQNIEDQVEIAIIFRARSIVAADLLGIIIVTLLFISTTLLDVHLNIRIGILFSIFVMCSLLIYIKTRIDRFEHYLNLGALVQVLTLFIIIYFIAFSGGGTGFFSIIWIIPLFLMTAFYFKPFYGFVFFIFNLIVYAAVCVYFGNKIYTPFEIANDFKQVYLLYLSMILFSCFILSYLFVHLNEQLKHEIGKQKGLLLESAKFQSLGQMASNLAHDVNNPLFTIQGKLHQIRNLFSHDDLDLDKCDQIIDDVESTILKLSQIVKGISTFARQGSEDSMVSVSADELIRGLVLLSSDRIVQSGITFDLKIAPATRVICYPSYITQVLINLLNNAIDAVENVEVKLIQIEAFSKDKWVEIHIKDSGPGVTLELQSKIFESFFTTKKYSKGSGLGLTISKGLIEAHEGVLKYQRFSNMTDFTICLPSYE